jgi:hypothetical protein
MIALGATACSRSPGNATSRYVRPCAGTNGIPAAVMVTAETALRANVLTCLEKGSKLDITQRARRVIAHGQQPPELLTLTPPLAEEFSVYGTPDTLARARSWALGNRYLLCGGVAECAHGLYLMADCPGECRQIARFDHVNLWVPTDIGDDGAERAFILYHPYRKEVEGDVSTYAQAHGLEVSSNREDDGWYGSGTLAVRMSIPQTSQPLPLERDSAELLRKAVFWWIEEEEIAPSD